MPRSKIFRDLEPLPRRSSIGHSDDRLHRLRQLLKSLALKNQREQPRVFYSLREVAQQFHVPVSTVSKIYQDMEQEGFLSRVRGSKTILRGLRYDRQISAQAFVALPALLSNFITIQNYRMFFICVQRELWERGFATTTVFFRPDEAVTAELADRVKALGADTVLWLHPGRTAKGSVTRLTELGIRVVLISGVGTPGSPSRYYVWRERALETLLRDWKERNAVRKITVVDSKDYRSPVTEEILRVMLDNSGFDVAVRTFRNETPADFLRELCGIRTDGIIVPSGGLASVLSFQCPNGVAELLRKHRVAFVDGPIDMPFVEIPDLLVDVITFDWPAISETIVNDLISREAFDAGRHTTFEAEAFLRTPVGNFAETIRPVRSSGSN
jgi:DNA-binding transcriptional regulator YhcF (GntR family)